VRLAFTDAFDLRRVQGIDLRSTLTVVLVAQAAGQAQLSGEDPLQRVVAGNPAADVTDHPAEIGLQFAQLSCSKARSFSSPMRWRQRVSEERSNTRRCWKNSSPQKYWKYGFSTPTVAQHFVRQIVHVFEDGQPRHQPRRQWRMTGFVGVDRAEPLFQKAPINRTRQLHQRVVHVDDLVQTQPEQVVLAALPILLRSHLRSSAQSTQAERITSSDSKESPNRICKETEVPAPKTGKYDYFIASDRPRRSMLRSSSRTTR
jgi:hypothetical protein